MVPAKTEVSDKMSKQLKKDGFKFVGSTICYAFMQAVGMVNDHTQACVIGQHKLWLAVNRNKFATAIFAPSIGNHCHDTNACPD